jgi:hypothetical protein
LEFLVYFLEALNFRDTHLLIHSDNQGAIRALEKGPNFHINRSVPCTYTVLIARFITHHLKFIPSENNPADPISRGELWSPDLCIPRSFSLPDELVPIFYHED